jgi:tetratricopeptide (TPR) repeat protein
LLLLFVSITVFTTLYVAEPAWTLLVRVPAQIEAKQFHDAKHQCERVLALKPSFLAETANTQIGATHLAAAADEIAKQNFSAAQDWLNGLLQRAGEPTGSETEAGHLLKELPALHYKQAHALWLAKDFEPALIEYEEMERLYKNDPILMRVRPEACLATVELAKQLNEAGDPEAALDRLSRLQVPHLPPHMVKAAWQDVPDWGEKAIQGRLDRSEYDRAFALMEAMDDRFPGDPELAFRLKDLRARFDLKLFHVALEDPTRQRKDAASRANAKVAEEEMATLNLQNESSHPVRFLCVGPQRVEITVPANSTHQVELAPGRYLMGAYSPETRKIRPKRWQKIFRAGEASNYLWKVV